jgi:hypothetical protein
MAKRLAAKRKQGRGGRKPPAPDADGGTRQARVPRKAGHAVYVGILTAGTTSRMRAEVLRGLTPQWEWTWVDTDGPMRACPRLWRTLAFRAGLGKAGVG